MPHTLPQAPRIPQPGPPAADGLLSAALPWAVTEVGGVRMGLTRSVLAVGAHAGDIEAGCAATLAAHRAAGHSVTMLVLADPAPSAEAAARTLDCLLVKGETTVAAIENVITGVDADVVYVHAPDDSTADHRAAAAATLSAARHGRRVLHYAGPTTLRFEPSVFVDVSGHLDRKLAVVPDPEAATGAARHFGALARVRYAEAFAPTRFVWDLGVEGTGS